MNHLIVKIRERDRKSSKYRKVLSGEALFVLPDNWADSIDYSPNTLLDEGDWFVIKEFSVKEYCPEELLSTFNSVDFAILDKQTFEQIDFIFSSRDSYVIQKSFLLTSPCRSQAISINCRNSLSFLGSSVMM